MRYQVQVKFPGRDWKACVTNKWEDDIVISSRAVEFDSEYDAWIEVQDRVDTYRREFSHRKCPGYRVVAV